jgi:hypothetical protein
MCLALVGDGVAKIPQTPFIGFVGLQFMSEFESQLFDFKAFI